MKKTYKTLIQKFIKSFTLLELLLSIAIIMVIFSLSIPFYNTFYINSVYNDTISEIRQNLYRAQARARNCEADSSWSLRIENNQLYIYKGDDFNNRDTKQDENTEIAKNIQISGTPDIHFQKLDGMPDQEATIQISAHTKNQTIIINSEGSIN